MTAAIGQALSVRFGLWYLYAAVVHGSPVARRSMLSYRKGGER
ncbi:hypothetical protein [Micromonospora sp. CNB394]|nr:hypothetical protein [Micromonospora sp. CNB394]